MSLYGIIINKQNPTFTIEKFLFWMPQYKDYLLTSEGTQDFEYVYELVNQKIFKSIFGSDWDLAMSLAIAHYFQLRANNLLVPAGSTLSEIAGGGTIKGILSSASVGQFSKSYDIDKTVLSNKESAFWNQTSYGASLMALLATKSLPSIMVATSGPIVPRTTKKIRFPFVNDTEE